MAINKPDKDSRLAIPSTAWVEELVEQYHAEALEAAETEGDATVDDEGNPVIHIDTQWGIRSLTIPYFNLDGVTPGEEAVMTINGDGDPVLSGPI